MSDSTILGPNPSGLCMCGCGGKAPIAIGNDKRYGIVKGQPQRYIKGHQVFKSPSAVPYTIDERTGCWVWQRAVNSSGYGHLYVDGEHKYAHIHYYEQANGVECDSGRTLFATQVHHKCGNKRCVNPEHLEAANTEAHRREHGIIRLTASNVENIRGLAASGTRRKEIEGTYGVSQSHIAGIINGRYWTATSSPTGDEPS